MSRIYSNEPLKTLAVKNLTYSSDWPSQSLPGSGVLIEAVVKNRFRFNITDVKNQKFKYYLLSIQLKKAHNRVFENGKEIEPNFSLTEKIRTGFLNSSYKTSNKGKSDVLNILQLTVKTQKKEILTPFLDHNPALKSSLCFLVEENLLKDIELMNEDQVRMRTKGDGPFIESIGKIDLLTSTISNFSGDNKMEENWTDKIMFIKHLKEEADEKKSQASNDVQEDEWDD